MSLNKSNIDIASYTWNPITGCRIGCPYCYARKIAEKNQTLFLEPKSFLSKGYEINEHKGIPFPYGFTPTLHPYRLKEPLDEKDSRFIFVCSMGDLFDISFPDDYRREIFQIMEKAYWHTFMIITKNPKEMKRFINDYGQKRIPKNLWIGVTAENQTKAKQRIPILLSIPDINCFVIFEPLTGPIDLKIFVDLKTNNHIKYIILGGMTGKESPPINPEWVRRIRDICLKNNIGFNFKQWGEWDSERNLKNIYDNNELIGIKKYIFDNGEIMYKVGKYNTTRLLDGKEHRDKIIFLGKSRQESLF